MYDHNSIEKKWQAHWKQNETFKVEVDPSKPKYYILDMFPYPSGAGLHVGHVTGYTATDILARYKRTKGFNVLHPMGWDSFGLPAEQYAVRTGTHPEITTKKNIDTYRRQLQSVGFSYDWSREITTSEPGYYKWTQWIFTKLFEKGLAYEAEILVNYCPHLGTVLANEEVENGKSKEGGFPVERRPLRQWVLKITAYAEQLLADLDSLDWPDYLKRLQRNWIGKSSGAKISFKVKDSDHHIDVFTTRPDTIHGVSFLVVAPEHPLLAQVAKNDVSEYLEETAKKSDLDRTDLNKDKTGVFSGAYAINPITNEEVPIWVADYVLMGYGTGAIMAVPSGDERDAEFATKYNLPIPPFEEMSLDDAITLLEKSGAGQRCITYKLRDWLFSRQRYWGEPFPILHLEDGTKRTLELDELPLVPPEVSDYKPSGDGQSPLAKERQWVEVDDPKTGKKALRETNTMPQWAGSCWYYLRFLDPQNDAQAWSPEKENYWMPVDMYVGGVEHAVLHLLYARFWHKVLFDCGLVSTNEPFQTLRNQGLVTAKSYKKPEGGYLTPEEGEKDPTAEVLVEKMSKSKLNGVTPDDMVEEYGADALRLYEMFMAPFDKEKLWNTDAVSGCYRFLKRFWEMCTSSKITDSSEPAGLKLAHRLAFGVEKDIEGMQFNTAIAKMMEFMNAFTPLESYPKEAVKMAVQCLYPFAPHISEECWQILGGEGELTYAPFPLIDPKFLEDDTVPYIIQVNGKMRGKWDLPKGKTQEEMLELIKDDERVRKYLEAGEIARVIYVPNKLLNVVVK